MFRQRNIAPAWTDTVIAGGLSADRFGFNVKVENIMTNCNYLDFLFHILKQQGMSKMTNYTACLLRWFFLVL